jgi:peptidoglycan/xylan/chitin deacetylase (PgdA/CDA1 family)
MACKNRVLATATLIALGLAGAGAAAAADGAPPARLTLDRRSLAPTPDYAMPQGAGTVSPARIAADGWQHCALSFDDGPNEVTPRILALLDREQVVATYFPVAATAARHPEVIRGFVAGGHEIGNHSLRHANLAKQSTAAQRADLAEANRILAGLGTRPALFRPPYASYDARLIESARAVGLETVLWSLDVRDWEVRDAGMLAARVDAGAGPALVVLLHATYEWTERALPGIIAALRGHGCRFVTLSQWLAFMQGGPPADRPILVAAAPPAAAAAPPAPVAPTHIVLPATEPPPPFVDVPSSPPDRPLAVAAAHPRAPATPPAALAWHVVPASAPPPDDADARPAATPAPAPAPTPPRTVVAAAVVAAPTPAASPAVVVAATSPAATAPTARPAAAPPAPPPPAVTPARPPASPAVARTARAAPPPTLTLRPATLATTRDHRTVLRIEGDDVYLQLGPGADLDAIAAQLKQALERPRRQPASN